MKKTVLVTGVGGVVGQGIIRNIIHCKYHVKIIGTNTISVSGGNHLCDTVYEVPMADDEKYIDYITRICTEEKVDLIIPSTDAETYYLALAWKKLPQISTSAVQIAWTFYNKYLTWKSFHAAGIPFADTFLPSEYNNNFSEYIIKPILGRGSRSIYINSQNPKEFTDDYIIQQLLKGTELTTAFYVTKQKGLLGSITFERVLEHGYTYKCEVSTRYQNQINKLLLAITNTFEIKGSCNIQSIVEDLTGKVIPFEVNGRISGTNSIRSQFGFEDVKYTIEEYLYDRTPQIPHVTHGSAVRILTDIIYPNKKLKDIKNNKDTFYIF